MKKNMITITVDIDKDVLLILALEAHKRDIKLNDYIVMILESYIKEKENG